MGVSIPASVASINACALSGSGLTTISVDVDNACYYSVEGILYGAGKTTLIVCPQNSLVQNLVVPSTVTAIEDKAFYNNKNTRTSLSVLSSMVLVSLQNMLFERYIAH